MHLNDARHNPATQPAVVLEERKVISKARDKAVPNIEVRTAPIETDVLVIRGPCAGTAVECITHFINRFRKSVVSVELQSLPRTISQDELATMIDRLERVGAEVIATNRWVDSARVPPRVRPS